MKYFSMKELTSSATAKRKGIDNTPDAKSRAALSALVANVLDPLRQKYGKPIVVTSGYRSVKLNRAVGGASKSQHTKGQAADIRSSKDSRTENKKIFDLILELKLPYDQLIDEYNYDWIHISYNEGANRRQVLHISK